MASRSQGIHNNQSAANYINKKGINELFEAIMTALMVNKPDDHITFIRECLDKVQNNPYRVRWDLFVTNTSNTKGALPSRPSIVKSRQKPLPPVRATNSTPRISQLADRRTSTKPAALPPIENNRKNSENLPIIFILSLSSSTKLCSRLMERYKQITYLYINDIASIDENNHIDLKKQEYRFDCVQNAVEQYRANTCGLLIAGHPDEKTFSKKWQEKLGRIDLIILLSSNRQIISNETIPILQIDSSNDFDTILAHAIRASDEIFTRNINLISEHFQLIDSKTSQFTLPIVFCIDNHRLSNKENDLKVMEHLSIDDEFDLTNEENEEESNNSFIYTLSERLAEQFSFKHIHYGDFNKILLNFDQLKTSIIESMSTYSGYIIDHFPTSFEDLQKFQTDIGPCSVLIYIGDHQTQTKDDELNGIVEKFKEANKAIYIDCRMEVDEIYEDLKKDILKHI